MSVDRLIPAGAVVHFVWGASRPLPPALPEGWAFLTSETDWLYVRDPVGAIYYVGCMEGDYYLVPARAGEFGETPLVIADVAEALPWPVAVEVSNE